MRLTDSSETTAARAMPAPLRLLVNGKPATTEEERYQGLLQAIAGLLTVGGIGGYSLTHSGPSGRVNIKIERALASEPVTQEVMK